MSEVKRWRWSIDLQCMVGIDDPSDLRAGHKFPWVIADDHDRKVAELEAEVKRLNDYIGNAFAELEAAREGI